MLVENYAEVTEPYTFDYINSLSQRRDQITSADGINTSNTLSLHLKNYIKNQLNNPADDDIVAEDEPPENSTDPSGHLTDTNTVSVPQAPSLGKSKKDKEKALKNGDIHDHLVTQQSFMVVKMNKKKTSKKFKAKAWREWKQDFIRENDASQMAMLTQSMAKFRCEDKIALRRHNNRFCNTGGNNPPSALNTFGVIHDGKHPYRPPSSSATYNSGVMPMQIRSRFQKK